MKKHNLAFIDIETTGLNVIEHEIVEIGCIITDHKLKTIEEFEFKIKPRHIENANKTALKINKYNEKDWEFGYEIEEAMKIFSEKVKDCIMIGQNVSFDFEFIDYNLNKYGIENTLHYHKLDTISIAWAKLHRDPSLKHFSLREMCKRFDIKNEQPHSGLSDARATFELYKKLMEM
ncbi:MAG TPA: 3'-5' exonuclease [Candidatus Paceibacterota bacterium]|nr:3'-5' exonuclease [Candidatus Paceibacterota bacterium]